MSGFKNNDDIIALAKTAVKDALGDSFVQFVDGYITDIENCMGNLGGCNRLHFFKKIVTVRVDRKDANTNYVKTKLIDVIVCLKCSSTKVQLQDAES